MDTNLVDNIQLHAGGSQQRIPHEDHSHSPPVAGEAFFEFRQPTERQKPRSKDSAIFYRDPFNQLEEENTLRGKELVLFVVFYVLVMALILVFFEMAMPVIFFDESAGERWRRRHVSFS